MEHVSRRTLTSFEQHIEGRTFAKESFFMSEVMVGALAMVAAEDWLRTGSRIRERDSGCLTEKTEQAGGQGSSMRYQEGKSSNGQRENLKEQNGSKRSRARKGYWGSLSEAWVHGLVNSGAALMVCRFGEDISFGCRLCEVCGMR